MGVELILGVLGVLCVLALAINAFFLRGIFGDLGAVKIQLAAMAARSESKELRLSNLEKNERELFKRLIELEKQI
jgi:hypothetical protein